MPRWLWMALGGWVEAVLRAPAVEPLLARLAETGVVLWDLERTPDGVRFRMRLGDVRRLRGVLRGSGARLRFVARGGGPFWLARVRARPGLLVGLVGAVLLVAYGTPRVWVVDVPGLAPWREGPVLAAAARAGLTPGAVRAGIDRGAVERAILAAVPGYAWAGVTLRGAVAVIQLYAVRPRPALGPAPSLVARAPAHVTAVSVYVGEAAVAPGDTVRAGQTLIRGWSAPGTGAAPVAAGRVWGDVTHTVRVVQPLRERVLVPTGRRVVRRWLVLPGGWAWWAGGGPPPPGPVIPSVTATPVRWRNLDLPATWVQVVYNVAIPEEQRFTPSAAEARARGRAAQAVRRLLGPGRTLVARTAHIVRERERVVITETVVVREDIAVPAAGRRR
ncbi:MAG: sporulation protein YqfD [Actinomycetia bacterium]|nr:sporulation protein YqfD [Actinomycetes bacterium]